MPPEVLGYYLGVVGYKHATHSCKSNKRGPGHHRRAKILYSSHIIALDLFCCHCRRHSYDSGFTVLKLCLVIYRSLNKADDCRSPAMVGKK